MSKYLVKRVLLAILSILIVSAITFFVMNLIPGGPFNKEKATSKEAQQVLEERYNLDKPVPEQYVLYMNNLLHGDWGVSLHSGRNIGTEISRKFACTQFYNLLFMELATDDSKAAEFVNHVIPKVVDIKNHSENPEIAPVVATTN